MLAAWAGGQTYTQRVRALGPIAYWPLAESSGTTANDESGTGRNGTYSGATLGVTGIGDGRTAASLPGSVASINVYSASLADAFNGQQGTLCGWAKVSGAALWTDGSQHELAIFLSALSNYLRIIKRTTNNGIRFEYVANSAGKTIDLTTSSTGWMFFAFTWDKTGDAAKAYYKDDTTPFAQVGATQTTLGAYSGALSSTDTVLGARNTSQTEVWNGPLAHWALFTSALSATALAALATV